ncbi:unnamed protein product [Prunus brigantina]
MVFHQNILALTLPIDLNDTVSEQSRDPAPRSILRKYVTWKLLQLEELNHNVFR